MAESQYSVVDGFTRLNVLVIGETMLDSYLEGAAHRLCREAPVPIIDVERCVESPGGAANTAVNLAALGCHVELLSLVGDDGDGSRVLGLLEARGVDTHGVLVISGRRTLVKQRVLSDGQLLLRFDQGCTDDAGDAAEGALAASLHGAAARCDAIVVSDYGYGVIGKRIIDALAAIQSKSPRVLVVDSRELQKFRRAHPTAVKPNYDEALKLLGIERVDGPDARAEQVAAQASRILSLTGARAGVITLDADGAVLFEQGLPVYRTYARPAKNQQAAGAGDTFVSALTAALAAGATTPTATEIASAAAAVVVGKDGTSTCSAVELREQLTAEDKVVGDVDRFAQRMSLYREQGKRIVFTNGCFDILHRGHITYLNRAKALGDLLVVGLNSDASVTRLKGDARPINPLDDRMKVIEALSCVDHVIAFDDDTPIELLKKLRPDVYAKGGDYTRETLPEAAIVEAMGGVVQILPFLEERSTTNVIEKIRELADEAQPARAGHRNEHERARVGGRGTPSARRTRPVRKA